MSMRAISFAAALLASSTIATGTGGIPTLRPSGRPINDVEATTDSKRIDIDSLNRVLTDAEGRQRIFHGVNVVYKVDPFIPSDGEFDSQDSLNDEDIELLVKWGMNFVRLGVMWEAVEREEGVYDDAYLDKMVALVNKLGDAGIYTLVDAHQDVLARVICGEGMPNFYAKAMLEEDHACISPLTDKVMAAAYAAAGVCKDFDKYGFRLDDDGNPLIEDCQTVDFYEFYMSRQSMSLFGNFFNNKQGLQDKFIAFWDRVAQSFAGNEYVLGYDPLNEPFPGNPARDPMLLTPGHFDKTYLAPMYEKLFAKYQAHDTNQSMWFEPVPFPDEAGVAGGFVYNVGFDVPPGGEIGSNKHVLNDHTYCCQLSSSECATGEPQVAHADKCLKWHEKRIGTRAEDAERLGLPLFISEFGACLTEGPCTQEINQVCDVADEHLAGWAYWQFKTYEDLTTSAGAGSEGFWNQDGSLQDYKVKALARSYMPVTQGVLSSMNFDTQTADFTAQFTYDSSAAGGSVVYLNQEYWYTTNGPTVSVTADGTSVDLEAIEATYANNYYSFDLMKDLSIADGAVVVVSVSA